MKGHLDKKFITISLTIGFLAAFLSRFSVVTVAEDFSYASVFGVSMPGPLNLDSGTLGKGMIGTGGFPFSAFSDCILGAHGMILYYSSCESVSVIGEYSILLNAIFWSFIAYVILFLSRKCKKRNIEQ